jgi:peptidase E
MPKIYLLGGENIYKRDAQDVNQQAFNDAGESPNVTVFSWARASFDKSYHRQKTLHDYFRYLGARTVNTIDYSTNPKVIQEKISEADLVYLTGGVPSVLLERLKKAGVDNLIAQFEGVIVGRSAGALALCRRCVITCRSNKEVKLIDGLGLVDVTLKAHYKVANDESLKALSCREQIFAVPKGSALVSNNGELSFINSVFLFEKGESKKLN